MSRSTSFCPPVTPLHPGIFRGASIRHTVRPQGTRDWLAILTTGGSGLYRHANGELQTRPRDVTLFAPGAFQDYQCDPGGRRWDLYYAHFLPRPDWPLRWPEEAPGLMRLELSEATARKITGRWREMLRVLTSPLRRREQFGLNALEEILLWCDTENPRSGRREHDPRVRRAMAYLTEHAAERYSEKAMSRHAGLSGSRLRHLFQVEVGCPPREFLERERLRRARELLSLSRLTISEIAESLGFENAFYFSTRFRKYLGESPRTYRARLIGPRS